MTFVSFIHSYELEHTTIYYPKPHLSTTIYNLIYFPCFICSTLCCLDFGRTFTKYTTTSGSDSIMQTFTEHIGKEEEEEKSQVASWYAGKNILITGATGFMGKVLVEKLLRSCPDVKGLYLLIRSKRGLTPEVRKDQYLKCVVCT